MLKSLFREIGTSFRRSKAEAPAVDAASIDTDEWQARFRADDAHGRRVRADELQDRLQQSAQDERGWTLLGDWRLSLDQLAAAEEAFRRALRLKPAHARAQEGLGLALLKLGRLEEAHRHLELAHRASPEDADILTHWGLVSYEMGNLPGAAEKFQSAIERAPRNPHPWHNLALVALKQGAVEQSIAMLRKAIELKPDHGLAYSNLALALRRADRLEEALEAAELGVRHKPGNARVWVVLSDMQLNQGDFARSGESLAQAHQIDPRHVGLHVARGKLEMAKGRVEEARLAFEAALALDSTSPDARGGLGELKLLLGEWAAGWDLYEARRDVEASPVRRYPQSLWEGEDLMGRTLLVHAEQGMGDIILFASCLPELVQAGANCVLEVRPRMQSLFARSFPSMRVVGRAANAELSDWPADLPSIDYQIPFGSLPRWFRRSDSQFPAVTSGFLRPDQDRVEVWRRRLGNDGRLNVGLAWRGGLAGTARLQRSLAARDLVASLADLGVQLVCLQYGDVTQDLAEVEEHVGVSVHSGLSGMADLDDIAALTCACDVVVTVCSTQAHLTGALGRPGLVLVPGNPSWRYLHAGATIPWYPSLQLLRGSHDRGWSDVLSGVRQWVMQKRDAHLSQ